MSDRPLSYYINYNSYKWFATIYCEFVEHGSLQNRKQLDIANATAIKIKSSYVIVNNLSDLVAFITAGVTEI